MPGIMVAAPGVCNCIFGRHGTDGVAANHAKMA